MDIQKQQAQQIPIFLAKSTSQNGKIQNNNNKRSNTSLRTRTYSDTDSSYVPGKNKKTTFYIIILSLSGHKTKTKSL
jgi:hypothetical protein